VSRVHQPGVDRHRGRPDRVGEPRDPGEVPAQHVRVEPGLVELGERHRRLAAPRPAQAGLAERLDLHLAGESGVGHRQGDPALDRRRVGDLQLDQVAGVGAVTVEDLLQQERPDRVFEPVEIGEGEVGDRPRLTGGPEEREVVDDREPAVGHQADVELEHVGPLAQGEVVGLEGVFGGLGGGAAVGDDGGPAVRIDHTPSLPLGAG